MNFGKKKKDKEFGFKLKMIEQIDTLKLQNQHLQNKIKQLEQRVTDLEISRKVGF